MSVQMIRTFRESLKKSPQCGLGITYAEPGIIERIGADWDWIWIDGQHSILDDRDIVDAVRTGNLIQRPVVVRVPGHDPGAIGKALDTAAEGVMVPMINNADQAYRAVKASKFPPLGSRSFGGRRPAEQNGRGYANPGIPQPLLVCQIETAEGIKNVDAIAGVEGVDALFMGLDDIRLEAGLMMDNPLPDGYFSDTLRKVADAAKLHTIHAGGIFITPAAIREAVELGFRLLIPAADVFFFFFCSKEKAREVRACL